MTKARTGQSVSQRVEQFIAHFHSHLTEVDGLGSKQVKLYRGLVYVALLDLRR